MNSPLGQYAAPVAAVVCGGTIAVYLFALLFGAPLGIDDGARSQLHDLAIISLGAVVGSAVAVNGWKQPLDAAHNRLDANAERITVLEAAAGVEHEHKVAGG